MEKEKEFCLSDWIVHEEAIKAFIDIRSDKWIKMEDVRECFRLLKEEIDKIDLPKESSIQDYLVEAQERIDKLAGSKLIVPQADSGKTDSSIPEGTSKDVCEKCGLHQQAALNMAKAFVRSKSHPEMNSYWKYYKECLESGSCPCEKFKPKTVKGTVKETVKPKEVGDDWVDLVDIECGNCGVRGKSRMRRKS